MPCNASGELTLPRNGSGSYSLPEAPFVPLTTISSAAVNSDFSDIASALTASLARDGQGGMTAVLPLNTAGFTYTNDLNTGMHRTGSDAQAIKCGGTDIVAVTTSGVNVTGTISQNGVSILPVGLGPLPWSRVAAPSGWVFVGRLYSRATYAALWAVAEAEIALGSTFYTNGDGSTTFGVGLNMPGRVPACNDSISGSPAGTLTQAVLGFDPSIVGSAGGSQAITLSQAQLPAVSPTFTGVTQNIQINQTGIPYYSSFAGLGSGGVSSAIIAGQVGAITVTVTPVGTISALGSGSAHPNVQPSLITNYIIFAGV